MYTEDLLYEAVIYQTTCQESSGVDMMTRSEAGPVVAPQGGSSISRGCYESDDSVGLQGLKTNALQNPELMYQEGKPPKKFL
jgi:hypothetical protein